MIIPNQQHFCKGALLGNSVCHVTNEWHRLDERDSPFGPVIIIPHCILVNGNAHRHHQANRRPAIKHFLQNKSAAFPAY
jgi:hypothetical protein